MKSMLAGMKQSGLKLASLGAAVCLGAGVGKAAHFVAPADGPVPFHRDQLPIDVNTMSALSHQLVTLARAQKTDDVAALQTVARLIALAQALDPQNRDAEDLANQLKAKKKVHSADAQTVDRATNRTWQLESWLDSPEAGPEAKGLAKCLLDVMTAVDPDHPKAAAARSSGLHGAWDRWIAPASEFEEKVLVKKTTPISPELHPQTKPPEDSSKLDNVAVRLKEAAVYTPLWVIDETSRKTTLKTLQVKISAWNLNQGSGAQHKMAVTIYSENSQGLLQDLTTQVLMAVKQLHGDLPQDAKANIVIANNTEYLPALNHDSISGAEAVLVDAVLRGEEPAATVIGVIGADGSFKSPPRFWDLLRSLSNGPGGRLVIPSECAPIVSSILAIEDPGFFFKYEVLCASNLKELVERSAKRSTAPLDDASAKFKEIRDKLGTAAVGAFVANHFVRQRLAEVAQMYPEHLSAGMLAIQGEGKRPTRLPRLILAAEIRKALQPIFSIPSKPYDEIETKVLEGTCEQCKKSLETLARYTDTNDRTLAEPANGTLTSIRNFVRAKRAAHSSGATWKAEPAARLAYDAMVKVITSCKRDLMMELGERPQQETKPNQW